MDLNPGNNQNSAAKENSQIQSRIDSFFRSGDKQSAQISSQTSNNSQSNRDQAQVENIVEVIKHQARSGQIKGKKSELHDVMAILEYRKTKNGKSIEYKIQWAKHEPTWETEKILRPNLDELLNAYQQTNKIMSRTPGSSQQNLIQTEIELKTEQPKQEEQIQRIEKVAEKQKEQTMSQSNSVSKKDIKEAKKKEKENTSTKKSESKKQAAASNQMQQQIAKQDIYEEEKSETVIHVSPSKKNMYEDIDKAFVEMVGNWKKQKRQENKDVYKCSECDQRIDVEKKGSLYEVNYIGQNLHDPYDLVHTLPFQEKIGQSESIKMHSSSESFIKINTKNKVKVSPDELLELMNCQQPIMFKYFKPSIDILTFFLASINKEIIVPVTPDIKRITRSSKNVTPCSKFPEESVQLKSSLKKREQKDAEKKIAKEEKVGQNLDDQFTNALDSLMDESQDTNKEEKPKQIEENPKQLHPKSEKKNKNKEKTEVQKLETEIKEESTGTSNNVSKKRVQFNQIVTQAEFEKEQSEENNSQNNNQSQEEQDNDSDNEYNFEGISSDEEEQESGNFLKYMEYENEKAMKERHYLMKELKCKERRGSIFIDKVKKVVTVMKRASGKYDFIIEWEYCKNDNIKPSTSLVRGSHFVFSNPLLYRRFMEKTFVDTYTGTMVTISD
ncbi:UNKNOWN [Stylonychia lemnae]|uniref:Chromo domain-containing protein n=1 Tax=Stylonychia lemnae TaxID=5949 RepID=A0A078B3T7_STYLE|nr:UNKNOWN [Stylonychia lemnae]|eukprot:CDW89149.1 UNKNOWN [Stylonychia lemnae]